MISNGIKKIGPHLILFGIISISLMKYLIPENGNFIGGIDVSNIHFWNFSYIKDKICDWNIPLWNPYFYSGHPFLANPVTAVFYPTTILILGFSLPTAINLDIFLHLYISAAGVYFLIINYTKSWSAAFSGAIAYTISGYFIGKIFAGHLNFIHAAALIPWGFYFIEKFFMTKQVIHLVSSALIIALQILSGDLQTCYYTCLSLTIFFFAQYLFQKSELHQLKQTVSPAKIFLIIPITAFCFSAVQILPTLEFLSFSDRGQNTFEFSTFMSFPLKNFYTFLIPHPPTRQIFTFWELSCYIGILSIFLVFPGILFSKFRKTVNCYILITIVAFSITLGSNTPLYSLYFEFLPGIKAFRIPARCIIIAVFSLSVLTGFGIHTLQNKDLSKKECNIIAAISILILFYFLGGVLYFKIPVSSKEFKLAAIFALISIVIILFIRFERVKQFILYMIPLVLFSDLYINFSAQLPVINQNSLSAPKNYEYSFKKEPGLFRVAIPSCFDTIDQFGTLRGTKFHYFGINANSSMVINDYFQFVHKMADIPVIKENRHTLNPNLFKPDLIFSSKILNIKHAIVKRNSQYIMISSKKTFPRAALIENAIEIPHDKQIEYMKKADFNPEKTILLESLEKNCSARGIIHASNYTGENYVSIINYKPNRIEILAGSNKNSYLLLSELYYPGWLAYVDGIKMPILRADYLLRAIKLSPGNHNISFIYQPISFFIGAAISLLTLLFIVYFYYIEKQSSLAAKNKLQDRIEYES